jgi:hypothetical protein
LPQRFTGMTNRELLEQSFDIAWNVLTKSGDLADEESASRFLIGQIQSMMKRGEKRRLLLSNKAIDAYRNRRLVLSIAS